MGSRPNKASVKSLTISHRITLTMDTTRIRLNCKSNFRTWLLVGTRCTLNRRRPISINHRWIIVVMWRPKIKLAVNKQRLLSTQSSNQMLHVSLKAMLTEWQSIMKTMLITTNLFMAILSWRKMTKAQSIRPPQKSSQGLLLPKALSLTVEHVSTEILRGNLSVAVMIVPL